MRRDQVAWTQVYYISAIFIIVAIVYIKDKIKELFMNLKLKKQKQKLAVLQEARRIQREREEERK